MSTHELYFFKVRDQISGKWRQTRYRLSDDEAAIDGGKFKAVNNRDKNFADRKFQARMFDHKSRKSPVGALT
jgi:hypothetical protein